MKAVVVGGGIGGLAAAVALDRRGCEVEVLERAPEFTQVESLGPARAEAGCRSTAVFRNRQDPHEVVVLFEFEDLERARRHMGSEALRNAWQEAGVTDPGSRDVLDAVPVDV